ncbi:MAG: hypothetical protein ACJ8G3_02625 [Burkholderiaceae bacterium]
MKKDIISVAALERGAIYPCAKDDRTGLVIFSREAKRCIVSIMWNA